jgi:hypothetical protein
MFRPDRSLALLPSSHTTLGGVSKLRSEIMGTFH